MNKGPLVCVKCLKILDWYPDEPHLRCSVCGVCEAKYLYEYDEATIRDIIAKTPNWRNAHKKERRARGYETKAAKKCRGKTSLGNVYKTAEEAVTMAGRTTARIKKLVCAYHCKVCGKYHLGKVENFERWNKK
jgi:hypothetical protein